MTMNKRVSSHPQAHLKSSLIQNTDQPSTQWHWLDHLIKDNRVKRVAWYSLQ